MLLTELFEDVVDFNAFRRQNDPDFGNVIDTLRSTAAERYSSEGKFVRFLRDAEHDGTIPEWVVEVIFDESDPEQLRYFRGWNRDEQEWLIHDSPDDPRWRGGDSRYVSAVAWKKISRDEAERLFRQRHDDQIEQQLGRYNTTTQSTTAAGWDHFRYHRTDLDGTDIRRHPAHHEMFRQGKRFMILMINDNGAYEVVRNDAEMTDALEVYDRAVRQATIAAAPNVVSFPPRGRSSGAVARN